MSSTPALRFNVLGGKTRGVKTQGVKTRGEGGSQDCNETLKANVMDDPDKEDDVSQILSQIGGAAPCVTAAYRAEASAPFVSGSINGSFTTGCEQISAIVDAQYHAQQDIKCTLRKRAVEMNMTVMVDSEIEIINDGTISCGKEGFNAINKQKLVWVVKNELSGQDISKISKDIEKVVSTTLKAAQESKTEFGATPQGQKSYLTAKQKVKERFSQTEVIADIVNSVMMVVAKNKIKVINRGLIEGAGCNFNNETLLDLTAMSIISAVTDSTFQLKEVKSYVKDISVAQVNEAKGFPLPGWGSIIGGIAVLLLVIIGFYFYKQEEEKKKKRELKMRALQLKKKRGFAGRIAGPGPGLNRALNVNVPQPYYGAVPQQQQQQQLYNMLPQQQTYNMVPQQQQIYNTMAPAPVQTQAQQQQQQMYGQQMYGQQTIDQANALLRSG